MQLQEERKFPVRQITNITQITHNTNDEHKKYLGSAENSFRERYSNHLRDFNYKKYSSYKCSYLGHFSIAFKKF